MKKKHSEYIVLSVKYIPIYILTDRNFGFNLDHSIYKVLYIKLGSYRYSTSLM